MIDVPPHRPPEVREIAAWFDHDHLPHGPARAVSAMCEVLADEVIGGTPDSAELTAGLRKLLEAKDCFVRAALGT